ncbi:hypothetical protein CTAYLR_002916 [Chrysophaeum taylorii]|uniref:NADP-dependent oxidoreductase domain-containing protein n=1 Tax=Chrysophaeum taylorii TaxID=2483200 RepID=A0AAD7UMU9_9STRA|nr:hypothetical protein CTAYLR_002916 [Chrysophaeum taylorii]
MGSREIEAALGAGVSLIDTARASEWYDEKAAADAVMRHNRSSIVVVTKLHPRDHGYDSCARAIEDSARKFGGYVDVFLQHYPRCWGSLCGGTSTPEGTWRDSWRAMEAALHRGLARAIGVSNVSPRDLDDLLSFSNEGPHVVQNWMDPFHQDRETRARCKAAGIAFMSYSTLGTQWEMRSGRNLVVSNSVLRRIAADKNATVFSVALSWALQRDAIVVPRSANPDHVRANSRVFDLTLSDDDLKAVDALDGTAASVPEPVTATFFADDGASCDLFWVEENQPLVEVGVLRPDRPLKISTYDGHVFLARQREQQQLGKINSSSSSSSNRRQMIFRISSGREAEQRFHYAAARATVVADDNGGNNEEELPTEEL